MIPSSTHILQSNVPPQNAAAANSTAVHINAQEKTTTGNFWGEDGFGFDDFIDIINPLQHIPVVSTIYREITGDSISEGASMAGGTLFGGIIGAAASFADSVVEAASGSDTATHIAKLINDDTTNTTTQTTVAQTTTTTTSPTQQPSLSTIKTAAKLTEYEAMSHFNTTHTENTLNATTSPYSEQLRAAQHYVTQTAQAEMHTLAQLALTDFDNTENTSSKREHTSR